MKILYLSHDGLTDPLGQSQVIPYLIGLSDLGYRITVISCEKENNYQAGRNDIRNLLNKNRLSWHHVYYHKNPLIFSFNLFLMYKLAVRLHKYETFKIVHARSYVAALMGYILKNNYGIKFLFDIRGFWADERKEGKIWNMNNPIYKFLYRFFKKMEVEYFSNADYTVSLTHKAKSIIHKRTDIKNQPIPIEVIPCCADTMHFSKKNIDTEFVNQIKDKLNINEKDFVISYLGSFGTWYMFDEMLDFFKRLLIKKSNARFLFITPENKANIINKAIKKGILPEKIMVEKTDYGKIPSMLSLSTVSLFFIKPVFSKNASSPTKQGEILSMGIPILCNSGVGDTAEIIRENDAGIVMDEFTDFAYDQAILALDDLLTLPADHLRNVAETFFSLKNGVNLYDRIYKSVLTS